MTATADSLLRFRTRFPILDSTTYLVSNSLGAMPSDVPSHLGEYADAWKTRGVRAWADKWWELPIQVGNTIAPLIGAHAGEVVMVPTVTQAMSQVLASMPFDDARSEVVMTALDFPSVRYAYEALAPRIGAKIVVVPSRDGISVDIDELLAAITPRTRLVAISHVFFRSAFIVDVEEVCKRAREVGARVALDAYHSVGVMPVNVHALGVDFLCGGVLKWLCGGPGGCFLYASQDATQQLEPVLTGWQAHRTPFAFADTMHYASSQWRWLAGTPVIPALYAAMAGPQIVAEAGLDAIRAKSIRQTSNLIGAAESRGWRVHAPRDSAQRGGTVALDVPHAAEVARALLDSDIVIDFRPGAGIRVAPHFYSTDAELERCISRIDDILASGEWQRWASVETVVT